MANVVFQIVQIMVNKFTFLGFRGAISPPLLVPQRCEILTNEDVLSSFDIFEIPSVSKKLDFLYDTNLAMIGRGFYNNMSMCLQ